MCCGRGGAIRHPPRESWVSISPHVFTPRSETDDACRPRSRVARPACIGQHIETIAQPYVMPGANTALERRDASAFPLYLHHNGRSQVAALLAAGTAYTKPS